MLFHQLMNTALNLLVKPSEFRKGPDPELDAHCNNLGRLYIRHIRPNDLSNCLQRAVFSLFSCHVH